MFSVHDQINRRALRFEGTYLSDEKAQVAYLGLLDDVAFHGLLELLFGGRAEVGKLDVERVELEEIPVPADGRARAAPAGALP